MIQGTPDNGNVIHAIDTLRTALSALLEQARGAEAAGVSSPAIQELVLARRHLEDARMRYGVAATYLGNLDPWASKTSQVHADQEGAAK